MFELACLGVPSLVVSLSDLHRTLAHNFARHGCSRHLGPHQRFDARALVSHCSEILGHADTWRAMRKAALKTVSGSGARRICDVLWELAGGY